ncbi:MAG: hypothetical protein Q7T17_14165 [Microbacterium sp.]|uniref:hypothetical protein n=1 Tax=Microbacterium sp. TaxID=51671 RepID=UPI0027204817|nr:hypothetical protein [Microbacterium sp.]MDO8384109.1 hypothetical protein [Microbacterium sp.]
MLERSEHLRPLLGTDQLFSHLTAARIWGMPLPSRELQDEPLHVLSIADSAPMRREGVVGWETEDADVPHGMQDKIPLVAPAEVWTQLAVPGSLGRDPLTGHRRSLSADWLVAVGDYLVSGPRSYGRRYPLCTMADLRAALARHRSKRGAKALTLAIGQIRRPVDSSQETFLRLGLVAHGLPEPEVQFPVMTVEGLRHADLGYREARVLLEYQGDHHRLDRSQWLEDLRRVQLFQDAGFRPILVGANDLGPGLPALAARVRRALSV